MTKEELIEKLLEIPLKPGRCRDEEVQHVEADRLLIEYINDSRVTEAFENIEKWYA